MRKRIVIALLAIVVIGVVAFVLTRPKPGTVEWHISKCRNAHRQLNEITPWRIRMDQAWNLVRGNEGSSYVLETFERWEKHQRALVKLGYLEERELVLSNRSIDEVIYESDRVARADRRWPHFGREFVNVATRGTNILVIVARRNDMPMVVDWIRKADVP